MQGYITLIDVLSVPGTSHNLVLKFSSFEGQSFHLYLVIKIKKKKNQTNTTGMNADRQHKGKTSCHKLIIKLLLHTSLLNQKRVTTLQSDFFAFLLGTAQVNAGVSHEVCKSGLAVAAELLTRCCSFSVKFQGYSEPDLRILTYQSWLRMKCSLHSSELSDTEITGSYNLQPLAQKSTFSIPA